ncbi:group III truncated hemoglobin [Nitratireductor alexandrii]|uniref:group III truncated hemoglobin n=1 Tax=Nitratireductor alexandrii TaxID=2448161 RepID=UPI000FDCB2AC|nr:group III truncated hemoglobin [Nitratireductor alexandrii]
MSDRFSLRARPVQPREPAVPDSVDRAFIGQLVRDFYGRVRADPRLGPIFAGEIGQAWEPHLEKMTDFWCSVILRNGAYHGRPVPAHIKLKQVRPEDFDIWLDLFRQTVSQRCEPALAAVFVERAERIATSLKLAMFYRLPAAGVAAGTDPTPPGEG